MAKRAFPSKQIGLADAFQMGSSASKLSSGILQKPAQGESVLDIVERPAQGESVPEDSEKKMRYDDALNPSSRCSSARQQEAESMRAKAEGLAFHTVGRGF